MLREAKEDTVLQGEYINLLRGLLKNSGFTDKVIEAAYMTGSFQNNMTSIRSRDDVLTLMAHLGYLAYDSEENAVFIPNEEVKEEFVLAVNGSRHEEMARLA